MILGFAGLGRMGRPMVGNLVKAGFELVVWNRSPGPAREVAAELGVGRADSPLDLANRADVVLTMLADDAASRTVHEGREGLLAGTRAKWLIEMGTMCPSHMAELRTMAPRGMRIVDAPVSGATQAAADAQLLIMAGCEADQAPVLDPLFNALGKRTIYLGKGGAGAVMKLAVNSLIHGINQTLAEALTLAEAAGIESEAAFDVIESSAAAAPMLSYRRPLYLDEANHDVTFTVALARKDMEITAHLAGSLGTAMPQGQATLRELLAAEQEGYGARDMASILAYMRKKTV